jgi:hypothetical protein
MKKYLSALILLSVGMAVTTPQFAAEPGASAPKKSGKPTEKKPTPKKSTAKKTPETKDTGEDDEEKEPDVTGSNSIDFECELGNKVTIYENAADDKHIALRWNKRLHRLTRVDTTTGANRFENRRYGLVWIGIPAKSMLLDSKKGKQLANECKNAEQLKAKASATDVPANLITGPATPAEPATSAAPATVPSPEKPQN